MNNRMLNLENYDYLREEFNKFFEVYRERPILDNQGGMGLNHSFATFQILREFKPILVVESGVWKGHSTWLIENALPEVKILSFDLNFQNLIYKTDRADYYETDIMNFDWSNYNLENALLFLDDHQNAYQRLQQAYFLGFKSIIFEDNFPVGEGDCYSLKHIFANTGAPYLQMSSGYETRFTRKKNRKLENVLNDFLYQQSRIVTPNSNDAKNASRIISNIFEFPPVFLNSKSQWNTDYSGFYKTKKTIFEYAPQKGLDYTYTYITAVTLN